MKKWIALLLALIMALAFSGCAESLQQIEIPPLPQVTPTPAPVFVDSQTPVPSDGTIPVASAAPGAEATETPGVPITILPTPDQEGSATILVHIGRTGITDYDPAEGTELILDFSYDMPRVVSEDVPDAAERINEVLATVEETFYTGNSYGLNLKFLGYDNMLSIAEDNYAYVKEYQVEGMPLEFSDSLNVEVMRLDNSLLSLLYTNASFTGGSGSLFGQFALSFDMSSGETLSLEGLSSDPEALFSGLVQIMLDIAEQDENGYYSERILDSFLPPAGREEAFRNMLRDGSWYFDRDGLVLCSKISELGPESAGITEFHIPYARLVGLMDPRWLFPADRGGNGRITVCKLSELDGGETEILDKLTVTEGASQLCLVVEGRVYDVRVSRVYYVDRFYENGQLWAASTLENCALQLETEVPEGLPDLRITYYTADGERHGKLLSRSGADGSFLLVDDDIQAVG